jgi:hypothetical protein
MHILLISLKRVKKRILEGNKLSDFILKRNLRKIYGLYELGIDNLSKINFIEFLNLDI